ncbi:Aldolase-type TIM barrel [Penicillium bovifimosum]|uniref:Aldolase-type TIM barrel n=1 Tax=Penicillium bovifimosum TaxID=126998 RepID=A0A9W9KTV2_9EURO|nr:Aldolase-type TIM barrel [Penicillium bovifimosum]KAJ5118180.1 Aldolase-type TIM barrel [Penicillium bovifimosum]
MAAGCDFIEIQCSRLPSPRLLPEPSSIQRTDEYGGIENRIRLPLEIAQLTRDAVGENVPVFCPARALASQGAVDLIDISTGGLHPAQKITSRAGFQVPLAAVKRLSKILNEDDLDVILVGRAFQRDTGLAWQFAKDLDVEIAMAGQICQFTSYFQAQWVTLSWLAWTSKWNLFETIQRAGRTVTRIGSDTTTPLMKVDDLIRAILTEESDNRGEQPSFELSLALRLRVAFVA